MGTPTLVCVWSCPNFSVPAALLSTVEILAQLLGLRYKMVFVPFTGIDNHHRSVTLAAALLSNERAKSYGWLLRAFKKAFGREPMVAVTDQDPAMKIAVEKEFSNLRHQLCMWHIMEKLSTK
ncbi:FAR1-related sequence 5-like protein, partial [Tanacetum coccineum]